MTVTRTNKLAKPRRCVSQVSQVKSSPSQTLDSISISQDTSNMDHKNAVGHLFQEIYDNIESMSSPAASKAGMSEKASNQGITLAKTPLTPTIS